MAKRTRLSTQLRGEYDQIRKKVRFIAQQTILDVLEHAMRTQPSVTRTGGTFEIGKIPVLTSELVNSLSVGGQVGSEAYVGPIANYQLGQTLSFRWTAPHAAPIEYGFTTRSGTKVPGRFYVTTACDLFLDFARKRTAEVR